MLSTFNFVAGLGIVILQIGILVLVLAIIFRNNAIPQFISKNAKFFLATIFIGATIGSFIYQYGFGYEPCIWCWYQRVAIIPIAILSLTGNIGNNKTLQNQVMILAILGLLVAAFHIYIDVFPTGLDVCGTGPSCLARYVNQFGYVTIQVMSATVLLSGILISYVSKFYPQNTIVRN